MKRASMIALCLLLVTRGASAFNVDGFQSGMTASDLANVARARGLEAWEIASLPGNWAIGIRAQYRIDGSFYICPGVGLSSYSKSLDVDVDYAQTLERALVTWGQPKVTVKNGTWTGPGGGYVQSINMEWQRDMTRFTLSFSPEGRDGKGELRHNRGSSIAYVDLSRINRCPK